MKKFYRVLPEDQQKATKTLLGACKRLTRQQFYNQKHTAANQYSSEKLGKRAPKHANVEEFPDIPEEGYRGVSKLSMRFYVGAKLQSHYLFFT